MKTPFNERFLPSDFREEISDFQTTKAVNPKVLSEIDGVYYVDEYLSEEEEAQILKIIDQNEFSKVLQRRQQFYGKVYFHTKSDNLLLQPNLTNYKNDSVLDLDPFQPLISRLIKDGFFPNQSQQPNQVLVNEYTSSIGIRSHFEDELAFGDVIVTISLQDPIWMTLKRPKHKLNSCPIIEGYCRVLLKPRSLFIMSRECRFGWRHGISKSKNVDLGDGTSVPRKNGYKRISLTIRNLLDTRKQATSDQEGWFDSDRFQGDACNCNDERP